MEEKFRLMSKGRSVSSKSSFIGDNNEKALFVAISILDIGKLGELIA